MLARLLVGAGIALSTTAAGVLAYDRSTDDVSSPPLATVDRIFVDKSEHRMTVYRDGKPVRTFRVALGRGGLTPKERQGDNRVPEGHYRIVGRNPASAFHLSLKISYPTPEQLNAAQLRGIDPGGDIFIHGLPNGQSWLKTTHRRVDWTRGCIAVTNDEMDWLWRAVPDGTPIEITA